MSKFYVNSNGRVTMEIEGAELKYGGWLSNWSGRTDGVFHYNKVDRDTGEGYKYFTVKVPSEFINEVDGNTWTVDDLANIGVPVKTNPGNPEKGWDEEHTIKVNVSYKFKEPIVQIDMNGDIVHFGKDDVARLDNMAYEAPDLVLGFGKLNPDNGRRPCYLNEFYATATVSRMSLKHRQAAERDDEERYSDLPFEVEED